MYAMYHKYVWPMHFYVFLSLSCARAKPGYIQPLWEEQLVFETKAGSSDQHGSHVSGYGLNLMRVKTYQIGKIPAWWFDFAVRLWPVYFRSFKIRIYGSRSNCAWNRAEFCFFLDFLALRRRKKEKIKNQCKKRNPTGGRHLNPKAKQKQRRSEIQWNLME